MARKLGYILEKVEKLKVAVANENKMLCFKVCKGFTWKMQGKVFAVDVLILPLDSYDMILGVQWLAKLGNISWNFKKMQFEKDQQTITFIIDSSNDVTLIECDKLSKMLQNYLNYHYYNALYYMFSL